MEKMLLTTTPEDIGKRLDAFVAEKCDSISRSAAQNLIADQAVAVNAQVQSKNYKIQAKDTVTVTIPEPVVLDAFAQEIPLDIVFEDASLLVVNKPSGMVVHPAAGNLEGTMVNALMHHCHGQLSSINGVIRPGIVHRIDKDTSGLLVVAKDDATHQHLAAQFACHSIDRVYYAVVIGNVKQESGTIDAPLGRSQNDRKKMCVTDKNSKNAITHFEVLERLKGHTFLKVRLETGRTHQIRVHMAYVGHPVAGDPVYAPKGHQNPWGQYLHAGVLGFVHPKSGEKLLFEAPLPEEYTQFLNKLRGVTK